MYFYRWDDVNHQYQINCTHTKTSMAVTNISTGCKERSILLRHNASNGFWLCILVPIAYMVNLWRYSNGLEFQYKLSAIVAFGLAIQSVVTFWRLSLKRSAGFGSAASRWLVRAIPVVITAFLVWICLKQSTQFSVLTGALTMLGYEVLFLYVLRSLPQSFTLGEASVVVQGFVLLLLNTVVLIGGLTTHHHTDKEQQQVAVVVQFTLAGVAVIVALTKWINLFRGILFYGLLMAIGGLVMVLPVQPDSFALVVLVRFVFGDWERFWMFACAVILVGLTASFVALFVAFSGNSSTRTRKFFHILIVMVFVPGLIYQCQLLLVASGMMLSLFVLLETARLIRLVPISGVLQLAVSTFVDAQDSGVVALTPVYLLCGCSLPLWLHPCPCSVTDSAGAELLPLMAGVLSVGIGDAAASVFGSKYGRNKWMDGGVKSIEGTMFGIGAQVLTLAMFMNFGILNLTAVQLIVGLVAIVTNSVIEAITDQIDNLVLPLVTYIMLSLS